MNNKTYSKMVDKVSPPSPKGKDFLSAFVIGGLICVIGQLFRELFLYFNFDTMKFILFAKVPKILASSHF